MSVYVDKCAPGKQNVNPGIWWVYLYGNKVSLTFWMPGQIKITDVYETSLKRNHIHFYSLKYGALLVIVQLYWLFLNKYFDIELSVVVEYIFWFQLFRFLALIGKLYWTKYSDSEFKLIMSYMSGASSGVVSA